LDATTILKTVIRKFGDNYFDATAILKAVITKFGDNYLFSSAILKAVIRKFGNKLTSWVISAYSYDIPSVLH